MPRILMVLTSHGELGDTGKKTGFWLEEFAAPYYVFKDAGASVTLASPQGGQPPLDPKSDAPDAQTDAMRRHAVGLRQHVRDLADRNYPKLMGENALEVTIAFVPIEGALSAALGFDSAIQSEAFEKGVVFASPNTLMAVLRVVERLWTRDRIQKQAREIGEAGGLLLDALTSFLAEFDRVGSKLDDASKAFLDARNRLSDSRQAVIPRARRLVALGARGKRRVSEELLPELEEIAVVVDGEALQLVPGES